MFKVIRVSPGDEVIIPSLTFIAPVNAISYMGAFPIFMDSDDYYNIDSEKTIDFIKTNTIIKNGFSYNKITNRKISAIIPVHVWGNACDLDDLVIICNERNIKIIEDASESLGTVYNAGDHDTKHTGNIGILGCISFNGNKIITTGGGGMIITDDEELALKAKYLTTQAKDDPINYIHNEVGYNFRLTNIQAALGLAQLEQLPLFLRRKKEIYNLYVNSFNDIDGLEFQITPRYADNNHWINIIKLDEKKYGKGLEKILQKFELNNIQVRPVWRLNHQQIPYCNSETFRIENSPKLVSNSLCIPSSVSLNIKDIQKVVSILK